MKKQHNIYECANCDQTTVSEELIKRHVRWHIKNRPINPSTGEPLDLTKIGYWHIIYENGLMIVREPHRGKP